MVRKRAQTVRQQIDLVVLVVGGPEALLEAVQRVAPAATGARVETSPVDQAATAAAQHRPFAILLNEDLYALDPPEFTALGRDVGATVIAIMTEGQEPMALAKSVGEQLVKALEARYAR